MLLNEKPALSPNYKWHVVAMLWFMAFFNYADRQALSAVLPLLEKEMMLSKEQLGWLGSAFAWAYGLGAPFAGYIVDRVRRKTAILWGLQAWSIICIATASARTYPQLLFFRAAEGIGETFYFPASMSLLSDYHGKETRSRAMSIHQTSVYIGTIVGTFVAGWIGSVYGWRWSFIIFGVLGCILGLVLRRYLIEPERGASEPVKATVAESNPKLSLADFSPTLLLAMGGFCCANFVAVVLMTWMPKYLYDTFSLDLAIAGLMATAPIQLASMFAAPGGGWLADFLAQRTVRGRMMVQMIGVLAAAPCVYVCGSAQSATVIIVALILWGAFKGIYDANIFATAYDVVRPGARGAAAGLMNMVGWLLGGGPAPVIIGYLAERHGLGTAIGFASGVYVMAGILLAIGVLFFVKRDRARMLERMAVAG